MATYARLDDYRLAEKSDIDVSYGNERLTRIFNFKANQITTILNYEVGFNNEVGIAASVSTQMNIQNFANVESQEEIALLRVKLADLNKQAAKP